MSKVEVNQRVGVSSMGLLFAALVILKLLGKITISWWWVTAPIWGPAALLIVFLVFVALPVLVIAEWNK